jgi:hypothetical protein
LQEALDAEKASEETKPEEAKIEETKPVEAQVEQIKTDEPAKTDDDVILIDETKPEGVKLEDLVVTDEVEEKMETDEKVRFLVHTTPSNYLIFRLSPNQRLRRSRLTPKKKRTSTNEKLIAL